MFYSAPYFIVNVDEFLQEAETLSVQDMPRSASSLSVRTDASGAAVIIKMHNMQFAEFYLEINIFYMSNSIYMSYSIMLKYFLYFFFNFF